MKDPRCKHILVAASGSAEYVHTLQADRAMSGRITIMQRGDADSSLMNLGLSGVTFAELFESVGEIGTETNARANIWGVSI